MFVFWFASIPILAIWSFLSCENFTFGWEEVSMIVFWLVAPLKPVIVPIIMLCFG